MPTVRYFLRRKFDQDCAHPFGLYFVDKICSLAICKTGSWRPATKISHISTSYADVLQGTSGTRFPCTYYSTVNCYLYLLTGYALQNFPFRHFQVNSSFKILPLFLALNVSKFCQHQATLHQHANLCLYSFKRFNSSLFCKSHLGTYQSGISHTSPHIVSSHLNM